MKNMRFFPTLIFSIICLLFIVNVSFSQQTAGQLFEKALYVEEAKGELQEAIDLYQQVLKQYPENRSVAAKALLHVGLCYEKLGQNEAQKAYQQLVNKFPDQQKEVAIARERLSRLKRASEEIEKAPLIPKFTKIKIPTELSWSVALSPDGKDLALVSDKKLWKMPLRGNLGPGFPGTPVPLNTEGVEAEWSGLSWSRDGKWIAFNDYPRKDEKGNTINTQGIYLVPSVGGTPEKIIENYRSARVVNYRISLSPDGKKLAFSSVEDNKQHIYSKPVEGGVPKQLVEAEAREPVYSPDGNLIAYVEDKNIGRGEGDLGLWVMPANGGTPHKIADAGKATSPVWSADGSMIAFLDYTKGKEIFIVPVSNTGQAEGKPIAIDAPDGTEEVRLLAGWTPDNKIGALLVSKRAFALYTLPAQGGQSAMILHDTYALQPRWSQDGKQIYYVTPPKEGDNRMYRLGLATVSSNGGTGKRIPVISDKLPLNQLAFQAGNRLSPDGRTIISAAWTNADTSADLNFPRVKIWKIAVDGNKATQVTHKQGPYADGSPCWSPDGKKVAFVRVQLKKGSMEPYDDAGIYVVDSSGGEPELLVSEAGKWVNSLIWSPDGKMLAWLSQEQEAPQTKAKILNVFEFSNRETRIVGEVPSQHVNIETSWSPDSKRIAFNDGEGKVIKIINLQDGSIKDIETGLVDVTIHHLDWSPDGKKFVFGGTKGGYREFWMMDNFLPLEKLAQTVEAKTTEDPEGIGIRQIWKSPYLDDLGTVSYDGQFRSYVDWGTGDVAIHNLTTGEKKILTHEADLGDSTHFAESTVISKNGKKIAYSWWNPYNTNDLRLIDVDNPSPQLLYRKKGEELYPVSWLSDKELIIIRYDTNNKTVQIVSFEILNKTLQVKKALKGRPSPNLACSPDQKYIAYDFANETDNGNLDINLLLANGEREIPLIKHPANDRVLGWVPGRKQFLFISDRSGSWDLWAIPFYDGKTSGPARRIYTDIGEVRPMGFTQNGNCYFGFSRRNFYTSIAPFYAETDEIEVGSGKSLKGSNFWVKWSPDGQYLAYIKEAEGSWQLVVQDLKSDEEHKLADNLLQSRSPCWSPDGNSIMVVGTDKNQFHIKGYKGDIYSVDVKTGQTTKILQLSNYKYNVPEDDAFPLSDIEWSADGKSFFYLFFKDRLVKHDLETGEEEILFEHSDFERGILRLSPDGKNLLFGLKNPGDEKSRLFTIAAEGGKEKEVCTAQEANVFETALWSPDGKYIYFAERPDGTNLWRIPTEGGKPQKVWSSENRVEIFSIHPDGNQIAFSIRERTTEVRVIENLVQELEKLDNISK